MAKKLIYAIDDALWRTGEIVSSIFGILLVIGVPLALLFGLIRFVRIAWGN